jgi:glutamate/tyrosine decarboxylase-like PLP-dependent enzyme
MTFPKQGMTRGEVVAALEKMRAGDADWRRGRTFSLVYYESDELLELLKQAYGMFFSENALSPLAFPSLRRFESEVMAMVAELFHGGAEAAGTMTSGGSESVLMAVKAARERARAERPHVARPEMIVPASVHPAFEKAAHYFDVRPVHIPLGPDLRADVAAARAAVSENTILIVGSAPAYPHGVVDPIADLAALAAGRGIGMHVDACLGGFLLPWLERLGHPVPAFDFRVPGVTSISADLHKYGFAAKGASTVLYRTKALRRYQFFTYPDWPGGLYGSPSATGTRPGGAIAAAWAALRYLGEEGYLRIARRIMGAARALMDGVAATPGLRVLGKPDMSVFAFTSDTIDIYALGDAMTERGWHLDRNQMPPALHMMVTPAHEAIVEPFLADLRACARALEGAGPAQSGAAAMYGMMAAFPDRASVGNMVLEFMDDLDKL